MTDDSSPHDGEDEQDGARQGDRDRGPRGGGHGQSGGGHEQSARTVVVAVAANLAIAVVKGIAALFTGSAGLLAETAHSVADTGNQALLFIGLRKSTKKPDRRRPFGSGQERYFWALLAALGIFLVGGLLSVLEGVRSLLSPEPLEKPLWGVAVLVVAAGFEGYSWMTAHKQIRQNAAERSRSITEHLSRASDPSASTVLLEDSAALIGIALALIGLILHKITGQAVWDAVASILIGVLLMVVAVLLSRRSKSLLVDEGAPDDVLEYLRGRVADHDWVARVEDLNAMYVGPSQLLVTTRVALEPRILDGSATDLVGRLARLRRDILETPEVAEVALTLAEPHGTAEAHGTAEPHGTAGAQGPAAASGSDGHHGAAVPSGGTGPG
jgi:cation diffusion facilitator family transporter